MNEIIKAMYKSEMPKLKVVIGRFKHKATGEIHWCVDEVSNVFTTGKRMYLFDGREWEHIGGETLEGTERIMECLLDSMVEQMEKKQK